MIGNSEKRNKSSASSGMSKGLFGETDRSSGEYHFRSGYTQQVYSNAHYIPVDKSTNPPKYYKPDDYQASDNLKRRKRGLGFFAVLALCLCCALLGGIVGATLMSSSLDSRISALELEAAANSEELVASDENNDDVIRAYSSAVLSGEESSATFTPTEIYNSACNEVVNISVETVYRDKDGYTIPSTVSGSGFVITEDGYILTNYHVVQKAAEGSFPVSVVFYNGDAYNGDVISYEEESDIALVKIDAINLQAATIGDSSTILVGEEVFAVGNPYQILGFTMSSGRISALNRLIATEENENAIEMFQIDADIYEGNSGGPLYNNRGEVIGIVSAKFSASSKMDGIGFAIPINTAREKISDLMDNGYVSGKASLGAKFDDRYNAMYSRYYGMPIGAFINSVASGSCAESAGLKSGDIITRIGDSYVTGYDNIKTILRKYRAGDVAEIEFFRDGEISTVTVRFDEESTDNGQSNPDTSALPVEAAYRR